MWEVLQFQFMQHAMIAGLLTSIICGIIGTLVVVNRIVFISAGTAHAAYGGIGLAIFLGWPVLGTTLGFSLIVAMLVTVLTHKKKHRSDSLIGVLWAAGMAMGIILIDLTPGYRPDLISYLFGSILAVPEYELILMSVLSVFILATVFFFYRDFIAVSYDEEYARARGLPVNFLQFLLLAMISLSVVMSIRVVGLIMVIALLTISPLIVERNAKSLSTMMALSIGLNIFFTLGGLLLSFWFDLSSGASIITVAVVVYAFFFLRSHIKERI